MQTLYELTEEYLTLLEMAEDPDIDPQAFQDTLEGLGGEIEYKAEGYAKVIKQLEMQMDGCANEIKRLQNVKKAYENRIQSMKGNLETSMVATGKTKFKTGLFSFGIQKNPPSVVVDDEKQVPPEYLIIDYKVNKTAIKDALNAGEELEWAHMEQTEGLRIR